MRNIRFKLEDSAVDPREVRRFTGLYDNIKWEDLSKLEQGAWLACHTRDEWKGRPIFENSVVQIEGTASDRV